MFFVQILFGLVFGSFLNVLILRYNPEKKFTLKTAGGRSRCLHCGNVLRWFELVPVLSWIMQFGRCRNCRKRISFQYPVVELACAGIFLYVPQLIQQFLFQMNVLVAPWIVWASSIFWIVVFLMLLAAFFIDVRHYVIPNPLNFFIFCAGVVWVCVGYSLSFGDVISSGSFLGSFGDLFLFWSGQFWESFIFLHIAGMLIGAGFFLLVILFTRGRGMGMGDAKLMAGLGLLFGYPDIVLVMALSFLLGTLYAIPFLLTKKKGMKDMLPFGPFIVLAVFIVFFCGTRLMGGYFGIIESIGF